MAAATEQQAATLQEITQSANELADQATQLMKLTEGFKI
jgi:methyl-accepting chemotaxis protein